MVKDETLRDLRNEREALQTRLKTAREEVSRLELSIASLDSTIAILSGEAPSALGGLSEPPLQAAPFGRVSPMEAVRDLFTKHPDREFKHSEVGDYLEDLYKRNLLKTKTSKIFVNFGYIIMRLSQGEGRLIENIGRKGKPVYRLKRKPE